jgi:hypothetical protein
MQPLKFATLQAATAHAEESATKRGVLVARGVEAG